MKHNITVEGIKVYAFHGCLEEEKKIEEITSLMFL